MKKNIKFILLLVFIAIVAGFSGYLMKKNNLNDELVISNPTDISTASLFNANIMDNSGEMISFSKFEGQWLLLNFWATWCAPCREEIPELNEFSHKNKTIQTIAIAIDDLESVNKFTKKYPLSTYLLLLRTREFNYHNHLVMSGAFYPLVSLLALRKRLKKYFMEDSN
jgi:thiol-disulfide isomerase/thioredoxin